MENHRRFRQQHRNKENQCSNNKSLWTRRFNGQADYRRDELPPPADRSLHERVSSYRFLPGGRTGGDGGTGESGSRRGGTILIPKRYERNTAGSHQQRTTGKAEERCDKSELARSELFHSVGIVPRLSPAVRPLFRMSAGKAWFHYIAAEPWGMKPFITSPW